MITIRPAAFEDARLLAELNGIVHSLHVAAAPYFFKGPDPDALLSWFEEMLAQENVVILLGYMGDEPAGYTLLIDRSRPENLFAHPRRILILDQIAVKEEYWRAGLGRRFVEATRELARQREIPRLQVGVWAFNQRGQAFFASQGFELQQQTMEMEVGPVKEESTISVAA